LGDYFEALKVEFEALNWKLAGVGGTRRVLKFPSGNPPSIICLPRNDAVGGQTLSEGPGSHHNTIKDASCGHEQEGRSKK